MLAVAVVVACGGGLPIIGEDAGHDASTTLDATTDAPPLDATAADGPVHDANVVDVVMPGDVFACQGTLCGAVCVDTSSDPFNCGACGNACDSGSCANGQCAVVSDAPPQGPCVHSLCTTGPALVEGCDPSGCATKICDVSFAGDSYCCATAWDSTCVAEVDTYCTPYSCK
jgi:hypothetical protein